MAVAQPMRGGEVTGQPPLETNILILAPNKTYFMPLKTPRTAPGDPGSLSTRFPHPVFNIVSPLSVGGGECDLGFWGGGSEILGNEVPPPGIARDDTDSHYGGGGNIDCVIFSERIPKITSFVY